MDQQTLDGLAHRLAVLEGANRRLATSNRRMKLAGTAAFLGLAALVTMAQALPSAAPKIVEAESFIVRDAGGKVRGAFGVGDDGSLGIYLNDSKNTQRITLDIATNDSPGLDFYDASGRMRATLAVGPEGTPGLGLYDQSGKLRTSLDIPDKTTPGLGFYDASGKGQYGWP